MVMDNEMYIVYASDNNFADILGVSIVSLFENNKDEDIQLYILDYQMGSIHKSRIENSCRKYKKKMPVWIKAPNINDVLGIEVMTDRGSVSQYARLFISSYLPEHIQRILYLDCDIIINSSLEELWNMDMHENTVAALGDAFSRYYRANIGLEPNDIMFNSGVMLIDLIKWKENNIEKKLTDFIKDHCGKIQQGDQGALNAVLHDKVECFAPRFNSVTIFYDFTYENMLIYRKPPTFYNNDEIRVAVENPVIIHFTTSFLSKRPWIEGSEHTYKDKWLYYKSISLWKDEPLRKETACKWKSFYVRFYKIMPVGFSVRLAGIFQAYGRPAVNRWKNGVH